jgi:signal transduction histidine kinase
VHIEPGLLARGDPSLVHSVLENLVGNALKYSSRTPGATVHFGREPGDAGKARFFVRDNGAGFDMSKASTLFGAFQRFHSESEFPGTGVGLATVHRIVTRHGGVVSAESAPGKGAVFYFTLGAPGTVN